MSKAVKSLAEFERTLKQAGDALVCVDFHAKWCGPCKVISPVFEALAKGADASKVVFITVDVDDAADVAEVCGVSSMPTFAFYRSSKPIHGFVGADTRRLQTDYAKLLSGELPLTSKL